MPADLPRKVVKTGYFRWLNRLAARAVISATLQVREEVARDIRQRPNLPYEDRNSLRQLEAGFFSAVELHNPGTKASHKAMKDTNSLDYALSVVKMDRSGDELLDSFRQQVERTFLWRRSLRRKHAMARLTVKGKLSGGFNETTHWTE